MPLKDGNYNIPFIGEYTTIGYGFSIAKRRRKPISPCISEGSILKITNEEKINHEEMLYYGLYSILDLTNRDDYYKYVGKLGYASFLPLT